MNYELLFRMELEKNSILKETIEELQEEKEIYKKLYFQKCREVEELQQTPQVIIDNRNFEISIYS